MKCIGKVKAVDSKTSYYSFVSKNFFIKSLMEIIKHKQQFMRMKDLINY